MMHLKKIRFIFAITVATCWLIRPGVLHAQTTSVVRLGFDAPPQVGTLNLKLGSVTNQPTRTEPGSLHGIGTTPGLNFNTLATLDNIPVEAGQFYRMRAWLKRVASHKNAHCQVFFSGVIDEREANWAAWNPVNGVAFGKPDEIQGDWRRADRVFCVPENCTNVTVRFGAYLTHGEEVWFDDFELDRLPPRLDADYICYSDRQVVEVMVNALSLRPPESLEVPGGRIVFVDKGTGEIVKRQDVGSFQSPTRPYVLAIDQIPGGTYSIRITAVDRNGQAIATRDLDFEIIRDAPWMHHNIGILPPDADAPEPWSNLQYLNSAEQGNPGGAVPTEETGTQTDQVVCWGREHVFAPPPFPTQIRSVGRNLLAAPIHLDIETDFGPWPMEACSWTPTNLTAQKGDFAFSASSEEGVVTGTMEIEFDGMMKYTLTIQPTDGQSIRLRRLALRLPMSLRDSTVFYAPVLHTWGKRSEMDFSLENWKIDQFVNWFYVGTERRGMVWFAESDENWNVSEACYVESQSEADIRTLVVHMVDSPLTVESPVTYVFGLQATPVRPLHEKLSRINFRTRTGANLFLNWATPEYQKYFGFPVTPDDPSALDKLMRSRVTEKKRVRETTGAGYNIFYLFPCFFPVDAPPWKYFWNEWMVRPKRMDASLYTPSCLADIRREEVVNYAIYHAQQYLKQWSWSLDGWYYDGLSSMKMEANRNRYTVFAAREYAKRMYIMTQQIVPDFLIVKHGDIFPPISGFTHISLTGEHFRNFLAKDPDYLKFLSLAEVRQETAIDIGVGRMWLGQYIPFGSVNMTRREPTAHMVSLAFLHDNLIYPNFLNQSVFEEMEARRQPFRNAGAEFMPYWEGGGRIRMTQPGWVASVYQLPDRLLAVVFNTTQEDARGEVRVITRGMNLAPTAKPVVYDPVNDRETTCETFDHIPLTLPAHSGMLITIAE